ncbi:Antimicrobial peptide, SdpC family OS=Tsukamurella paurometabola (strain ATCC 8368 / DSM / CCUG 35730 / CIP 100753 / JCM 10117 / KCTC 9821 / NBRC 16120/ NCIMB 702349 / NCTC 13040) OX=521096 GN=Tpau_4246 PE=4 SV=1 [Tsukamurella paurometabola]|uniref:Antimicrobial peptide, SdpC family n=1 Tax=Tsukamurella paurometabola (strain ATCC 8368 / DSM 20162 / CCUG 35730 / CIP 100753 / JCM 10117 / KCTC 9821 / NBRC 16120 / NCIMB 702349 / NCTC 13040) TaxID=521096 RepID=D5UYW7_TSUPD|nr:sporulation delaying protein family toxin [Tsukamurella paurometabola]ADG80814.1 hypothetical protein Tpau_4246 [Tsukamurella paurometabola DSM 20162]SUQ39264.1 antimicrobial peptide, SdpC family [Tsukamurella paurometabola]
MNNTKRRATALIAATCIAGAAVTAAPALAQPVSSPLPASPAATGGTGGEEIFRAVLLGEGPLAQKLAASNPELLSKLASAYPQNNTPQALAAGNLIVDKINAKNPGYFAQFKSATTSGDPYAVEAAINDGPVQIRSAGITTKEIETEAPECGVFPFVALAVFHVAAAVTTVGGAVFELAAVAANAVYAQNVLWPNAERANGTASSLDRDRFMGQLTKSLQNVG